MTTLDEARKAMIRETWDQNKTGWSGDLAQRDVFKAYHRKPPIHPKIADFNRPIEPGHIDIFTFERKRVSVRLHENDNISDVTYVVCEGLVVDAWITDMKSDISRRFPNERLQVILDDHDKLQAMIDKQ